MERSTYDTDDAPSFRALRPLLDSACDTSELVELAKIAEATGRFKDMFETMCHLVTVDPLISPDERTLLNVAFQHVIAAERLSLSRLDAIANALHRQSTPATDNVDQGGSGEWMVQYAMSLQRQPNNAISATTPAGLLSSLDSEFSHLLDGKREKPTDSPRSAFHVADHYTSTSVATAERDVKVLRSRVTANIIDYCAQFASLFSDALLPCAHRRGPLHKLFLRKSHADVFRLLLDLELLESFHELHECPDEVESAGDVLALYSALLDEASVALPIHSPLRLGILITVIDVMVNHTDDLKGAHALCKRYLADVAVEPKRPAASDEIDQMRSLLLVLRRTEVVLGDLLNQ